MTVITESVAGERVAGVVPCLLVHYAPGVLAVLRRDRCPVVPHYAQTSCDRSTHTYLTVVSISGVEPGDEVLTGCDWPRRQEVLF